MLPPTVSAKVGVPPVVLTVITSLKETVALKVSLAFKLFTVASDALTTPPVELVKAKLVIVGAKVSKLSVGVVPAAPLLPAASW